MDLASSKIGDFRHSLAGCRPEVENMPFVRTWWHLHMKA